MRNLYEQTDKSLKKIKELIERTYKRLISLAFDEISAITADKIAEETYERFKKLNRKEYKKIVDDAIEYAFAFEEELREQYLNAGKKVPESLDFDKVEIKAEEMVEKVLKEYSPVTGYIYEREADRKQARLEEGMMAGKTNDDREFYRETIKTNTNLWYTQSKQYAEDIADKTVLEVWEQAGVPYVMWVTQRDEKVCKECGPLDGKIFPIDEVPDKPHYRCRCLKIPIGYIKT